MGLLGLAFFNGFEFMINSWLGSWNSEHEHVGPGGSAYLDGITNGEAPAMMGTGKWWWLGVTTGGGFLVGALKLFKPLNFPKEIHGLFLEATELHVDPYTAPALVLLSMISLGVGATVGPEMAMGTLGGAVGAFVSIKRGYNEEQRHMATLTGMAAGMGSLVRGERPPSLFKNIYTFGCLCASINWNSPRPHCNLFCACMILQVPSPPVACLMLWELTAVGEQPPHHFMQNIVNTGVAATAAYFVFDIVGPYTFVEIESSSIALYDVMVGGGATHLITTHTGAVGRSAHSSPPHRSPLEFPHRTLRSTATSRSGWVKPSSWGSSAALSVSCRCLPP